MPIKFVQIGHICLIVNATRAIMMNVNHDEHLCQRLQESRHADQILLMMQRDDLGIAITREP